MVARTADPRGGEYLDTVGFYNPKTQPAELRIDLSKVDSWLERGAEMSETAASLIRKVRKGGDASVLLREVGGVSLKSGEFEAAAPRKARRSGKRTTAATESAAAE